MISVANLTDEMILQEYRRALRDNDWDYYVTTQIALGYRRAKKVGHKKACRELIVAVINARKP